MHRRPLFRAAAAAALLAGATLAGAVPGPPLGCAGQHGVGGCAPYANVDYTDAAGSISMFEYDLARIAIGRSLPLTDVHGSADLQRGLLTVNMRSADDGNPSDHLYVHAMSTVSDVFTLHSATPLPPGGDLVNIVANVGAQGVGSIDFDYRTVSAYLHLGFGSGVALYGGGVLDAGSVLQALTQVTTFQQFTLPLAVYANLTVKVGVPFELNYSLRAFSVEGSFMNFDSFLGQAHGAQLAFGMPPGFRVTSLGGYDSAAPVPEAGTLALWLAGLGVVAAAAARRAPDEPDNCAPCGCPSPRCTARATTSSCSTRRARRSS